MVLVRRHARHWLAYIALGGLVLAFSITSPSASEDDLDLADRLQQPVPSSADTQSQHQAGSPKEHQHSGNAPSSAPETSSPSPTGQPKDENRIAAKPENEGEWYTRPDWWVAGFTGLLFIATAGLWFFTALLWSTTRRAVSDGERSVKAAIEVAAATRGHIQEAARAATAMENVSVAMNKQRKLMQGQQAIMTSQRDITLATERAWVRVTVKVAGPITVENGQINGFFTLELFNTGVLPAYMGSTQHSCCEPQSSGGRRSSDAQE